MSNQPDFEPDDINSDDDDKEIKEEFSDDDDDDNDDDPVSQLVDPTISAVPGIGSVGIENIQTMEQILPSVQPAQTIDVDSDTDSEYEEDSFQKFDDELKKDYILDIHPERKQYNYNEVMSMCSIVRDKNGNVVDAIHRTNPWLTKYEYTRILGQRIKQLNEGIAPFINVPDQIVDNSIIAQMELEQKKIPFIIRRPLPNGSSEFWKLSDLEIISH